MKIQLRKAIAFLIRARTYITIFQSEFIYISNSTNRGPIKFSVLKQNLVEVIFFTIIINFFL